MDLELIDGNPVVSHVVRFKDRTTITEHDAQAVRDGAVVVWIVRTLCQPPSYHPVAKDTDDRYRFNIQDVQAAAVLHGELRDGALAYLDDPTMTQGRFVFDAPVYNGEAGVVDVKDTPAFQETGTAWPPVYLYGSEEPVTTRPLPDLPDSAYPPGGTPLEVELDDDDETHRVVGSVYGAAGSDTQKLLEKWDDL